MTAKKEVSLINFFIFNAKFGPKEGDEHKKILFYFPHSVPLDTKIKQIGLCEAIITFTATFTDHPCESLHTHKTRQLFFQAEPDFWTVMTLGVPSIEKTVEGQTHTDYREEDIQDHVYRAVLQQTYHLYRLFNGTFQSTLTKCDVESLKQRLDHFFSKYLVTLRLNQVDIMTVFNGVQFLPLDKISYLRLQCFINQMEMIFPQIRYSVVLYNNHLVWSGLEQEDMRILYYYLTASLLPAITEQDFSTAPLVTSAEGSHFGRFILGPPDLQNEKNLGRISRVHLAGCDQEMEECFLVVYRALGALMCLLIQGDQQLDFDLFQKIDKFVGPQLSAIASDIAELTSRKNPSSTEMQFKYVYFNRMNFAQKTSIHTSNGLTPSVSSDVLRLIADIHNDLNTVTQVEDGETIVKTSNDSWIVGKKSDQREVYIIIHQKNANLIEINEEVKRLCSTHFNNIFFLD